MTLLSKDELKALIEASEKPCVSLYMPAQIAGPEIRQNPIRFKNLMRDATQQLVEQGWRETDANDFLKAAHDLDDANFWRYQDHGLAIFISPGKLRYYRLPLDFEELAVVGDRFHLKPLMPLLTGDGRFYLLAFSQNQVRLFLGSQYSIAEIELEGVPTDMKDAMRYEDVETGLQMHNSSATGLRGGSGVVHGQGGAGNVAPQGNQFQGAQGAGTFHGQAPDNAKHKNDILRYCQQLDEGIHNMIRGDHAPLVLAGVEYVTSLYRQANSYPHLVEERIDGNPDILKPEELHQKAWEMIQPYFQQAREQASERYQELAATDQASAEVSKVVPAAFYQQVDALFVAVSDQKWGQFNQQTGKVEVHADMQPNDMDLLDFAAAQTLINGGTVYAVEPDEMPDHSSVAAMFRYPTSAAR